MRRLNQVFGLGGVLREPTRKVVELVEKRHGQIFKVRGRQALVWHLHSINRRNAIFIPACARNISADLAGIFLRSGGFHGRSGGASMKGKDRRSFLKIAGTSLGIGVLYSAYPTAMAKGEVGDMFASLGRASGERVAPFSFIQL